MERDRVKIAEEIYRLAKETKWVAGKSSMQKQCDVSEDWIGFILLHEKELTEIDSVKEKIIKEHGDVTFELKRSPSSGEIFTKFYELHVIKRHSN